MEEQLPSPPMPSHQSSTPLILIILGSFGLISSLPLAFMLIPVTKQINGLYASLGETYTKTAYVYLLCFLWTILPLTLLIYGIYLKTLQRKNEQITEKQKMIGILIFVASIIFGSFLSSMIISLTVKPLYNIISNIDMTPSITLSTTITTTPTVTTSEQVYSPNRKKIAYIKTTQLKQTVYVSNPDRSDSIELLTREGPNADSWGPLLWSPKGTYIFLQVTPPDTSSFYVFKTDHSPFKNGKLYLDERTLNPIGGVYTNMVWLSETKLQISRNAGIIDKKLPDAMLDLEKETYTEVK